MKHNKNSLKDDVVSQHDVKNEKSCIIRRNEKEYKKLSKKIEEKIKKLDEFVDQSGE
ncbi:MAG: hypothetical protein P8Y18_07085 [Candidatus Bathyarchaeota archaeon]